MPDPIQILVEKAASQGMLVLFLVVGIYVVGKLMLKAIDGRVDDLKERISDHKERIAILEDKVTECEKDRDRLWMRLAGEVNGNAERPTA